MPDQEKNNAQALFRIAGIGASLAFGMMVATLFAVERGPGGFHFAVSVAAVIAFVFAAVIAWFYWRLVVRMATGQMVQQRRKRFLIASVGLLLVGVVGFLYPLKFIPPEKRQDVLVGLALAIGCITCVGLVMIKVKRFLDADQKQAEQGEPDDSAS